MYIMVIHDSENHPFKQINLNSILTSVYVTLLQLQHTETGGTEKNLMQ